MNCEVCELKELEVERSEIREVLRCVLHTILFHRALGLVRPKDVDCELFEITYAQCVDSTIEREVEEKIDEFISKVNKHPNRKIQICLAFYESSRVERLYWERWYVTLNVITPKAIVKPHQRKVSADPREHALEESNLHRTALESSLREVLFQILRFADEKKDHLPPISSSREVASYPYEITILSSSDSSFWWPVNVFRRVLQTGNPSLL